MDLSTLVTHEIDVNLEHRKSGTELGLVFHLSPPDSSESEAIDEAWLNKRLQPKNRNKALTSDELKAVKTKRIMACVKGWTWEDEDLNLGGEQPEYSQKILRSMLNDYPWIREFLGETIEDVSNFL